MSPRLILILVDGLGIGKSDPAVNSLAGENLKRLNIFFEGEKLRHPQDGCCIPTDATLGVEGIPQSATGQTTLLTGVNAAEKSRQHWPGFPNRTCREILKKHSILKQASEKQLSAIFVNAYRSIFFDLPLEKQYRLSATTVANLAAGLPFMKLEDIGKGRSLYHDYTNGYLVEKGFDVPRLDAENAADILSGISREHHLTFYEIFMTDRCGHKQDRMAARAEIEKLDALIEALLSRLDLNETTLLITSDHGNIEDLGVKTHTFNPAMTLVWGECQFFEERIHSLADITPAILEYLGI